MNSCLEARRKTKIFGSREAERPPKRKFIDVTNLLLRAIMGLTRTF